MTLALRFGAPQDTVQILELVRELAVYEKLEHTVSADEATLRKNLFGPRKVAEVILAFERDACAGFALFFHNFSTFLGKPGLYLEDLFIRPAFRGRGYGKALMVFLARLAVERGCGRFEWSVLDWNTPSIEFYGRLGAVPMSDWTVQRLTGPALEALARQPADIALSGKSGA
jgi:GNAT superfamily N-acetyltransferase